MDWALGTLWKQGTRGTKRGHQRTWPQRMGAILCVLIDLMRGGRGTLKGTLLNGLCILTFGHQRLIPLVIEDF
jgi:hypothetical protein